MAERQRGNQASTQTQISRFEAAVDHCPTTGAAEAFHCIRAWVESDFIMLHVVGWGNGLRWRCHGTACVSKNRDGYFSAIILF